MRPRFRPLVLLACLVGLAGPAPAQDSPKKKFDREKLPLDVTVSEEGTPPTRKLVVRTVTERGNGYRMGLVPGDVILGANGHKVDSLESLRARLYDGTATIIWQSKSGAYYRNSIYFESPPVAIAGGSAPPPPKTPPAATPRVRVGDLVEGKTLKDVEPPAPKTSDAVSPP